MLLMNAREYVYMRLRLFNNNYNKYKDKKQIQE